MSSYNHEKYVGQAIESVLNQSFNNLELIIVDDASDDNSAKIINKYAESDDRIWPVYHDENKGIAETLNDGLSRTRGKYIALIASDDLWATNKLEYQLNILDSTAGSLVWTQGQVINSDGHLTGETFIERHDAESSPKSGNLFHDLLRGNYIFGSSVLYNSTVHSDVKFDTDLRYLDDYKFYLNLSAKVRFEYIEKPLTYYRIHGTNTTSNKDWDEVTAEERLIIRRYARNNYGYQMKKHHLQRTHLQDTADWFRLNRFNQGIFAFLKALREKPYSIYNLLYFGYALSSYIPKAQPILWKLQDYLRSLSTNGE